MPWFTRPIKEKGAQEILKQDAKYRAMSEKLENKYESNTRVQNDPELLNRVIAKRIGLILRVSNKTPQDIEFISSNKDGAKVLIDIAPKDLIGYRRLMSLGDFYMKQGDAQPANIKGKQNQKEYADMAARAYEKAAKIKISTELTGAALAEQIIASKKAIEGKSGSWQEQAHSHNSKSPRANISMGDMQTDKKAAIPYYEKALKLTSDNKYKIHEKLLEIYSNPKYNTEIKEAKELAVEQFYKAEAADKGQLKLFMLKDKTIDPITQKPAVGSEHITQLRKDVTQNLVNKINPAMTKEERERSMEMLVGLYAPVTNLSKPTEISPEGRITAYLKLVEISTTHDPDPKNSTVNQYLAKEFLKKAKEEYPKETERFIAEKTGKKTLLSELLEEHRDEKAKSNPVFESREQIQEATDNLQKRVLTLKTGNQEEIKVIQNEMQALNTAMKSFDMQKPKDHKNAGTEAKQDADQEQKRGYSM